MIFFKTGLSTCSGAAELGSALAQTGKERKSSSKVRVVSKTLFLMAHPVLGLSLDSVILSQGNFKNNLLF